MTTPARATGKYGRRAPSGKPALRFADIRRAGATIPPHPAAEDYLARLSGWLMLGNDSAGDCVAVTWANMRRLVTAFLSTENYPTQDQVWTIYRTQNPAFDPNGTADTNGPGSSADGGMDIQTLLEYLVETGGPDGVKAVAFAKVDYNNVDELDAAQAIFGDVWTGVVVTDANEQEFAQGQPWDYNPTAQQVGGHSVLSGGYQPGQTKDITWAQETGFTDAFRQHQVEETWIVIWPEHLGTAQFQAGIDEAALAAAYEALTGRPFPVQPTPPAPSPTPVPPAPTPQPPAPTPVPPSPVSAADEAFAEVLRPWVAEHHICGNHRVQEAAEVWLDSLAGKGE